jgi:hypothetical protein
VTLRGQGTGELGLPRAEYSAKQWWQWEALGTEIET